MPLFSFVLYRLHEKKMYHDLLLYTTSTWKMTTVVVSGCVPSSAETRGYACNSLTFPCRMQDFDPYYYVTLLQHFSPLIHSSKWLLLYLIFKTLRYNFFPTKIKYLLTTAPSYKRVPSERLVSLVLMCVPTWSGGAGPNSLTGPAVPEPSLFPPQEAVLESSLPGPGGSVAGSKAASGGSLCCP